LRRILCFIVTVSLTLGFCTPARAQSAVAVTGAGVEYSFGEQITFTARIQSQSSIQEALLLFQVEGDPNTRVVPIQIGADGMTSYQYPLSAGLLRPFTRIYYWFRLTLQGGEIYTSPQFTFDYVDNRFPWQTLEDASVRLHWYAGEVSFGQAAFDVARLGLQAIANLIPVAPGEPIDIYIYATATDVQNALSLGGQPWLAGQASPDLGVVLVSISPGAEQTIAMQRQIPHELAHVLLYRHTGAAYNQLPAWLREGIASLAELYPNADYIQVLGIAAQNQALLPMADLCGLFPQDASGALLAYAESASFTRYLHETYGTSGLLTLIRAYADGLDCEQGAARAFGDSLSQMDQEWRQQALGENVGGLALHNLLPYLVVLAVILTFPAWGLWASRKRSGHAASRSK
jgi:hypothetical protein